MAFPLPFIPKADYHPSRAHTRWFGANRNRGKRKHAGCDLLAPLGTDIYSISDGHVFAVNERFYHGTGYIAVRHTGGFVVRYCEVKKESIRKWKPGMFVREGEVIAQVGKMNKDSMLHFELYAGTATGNLTNRSLKPFERRADLVNPTALLDKLKTQLLASGNFMTLPNAVVASIP